MIRDVDEHKQNNLAVLFDADNISKDYVRAIMDACARHGRAIIKRSYGDWTDARLQGWGPVFREFAIKPIQQFMFSTRKNITDSAMTIDTMDILHSKDVDVFILVSSDSDFTGLATRIREEGLKVIGIGRKKTSLAFINACDEFLILENLVEDATNKNAEVNSDKSAPIVEQGSSQNIQVQGRELLLRAVKILQDENGFVKGAALGVAIRRLDPAFTPKTYGVTRLADFIELFPDVLELQGRRTATDPTYKSKL